jgi:hypothetical protein
MRERIWGNEDYCNCVTIKVYIFATIFNEIV